jgi:hypothetical protein
MALRSAMKYYACHISSNIASACLAKIIADIYAAMKTGIKTWGKMAQHSKRSLIAISILHSPGCDHIRLILVEKEVRILGSTQSLCSVENSRRPSET